MAGLVVLFVLLIVPGAAAYCLFRPVGRRSAIAAAVGVFAALGGGAGMLINATASQSAAPVNFVATSYGTSDSCRKCHPDHYRSWHETYHRTMTQDPLPQNVQGDFNFAEVRFKGLACRLFRRGDKFYMDLPHPEWERSVLQAGETPGDEPQPPRAVYAVDRLIGSHNMQVYLTRLPNNEYRVLPLTWHTGENRWISREGSFLHPPSPGLFDKSFVWNNNCVFCHNTRANPGIVDSPDFPNQPATAWETSVAEMGIACEACHGPGHEHVALNRNPARRFFLHESGRADLSIVNPARLPQEASLNVCGRCHGRWTANSDWEARAMTEKDFFVPGGWGTEACYSIPVPSHDGNYAEEDQGMFWPDGTPQATGLEYQGTLASPCYQRGSMTCLSCHQLHGSDPDDQLKPDHVSAQGASNDQTCLQCHAEFATQDARDRHTHHAADSAGSRCVNCHMPYQSYGLLKAVRAHRIASPRVQPSGPGLSPNACNQCHVDQSLGWTAQWMASWYGHDEPELPPGDTEVSATLVELLRGNALQRALAAARLGSEDARVAAPGAWRAPFLLRAMEDDYPAVRFLAAKALRNVPGFEDAAYDYLADPSSRREHIERLLQQWERSFRDTAASPPETVPLDAAGRMIDTIVSPLLQAQDKSDVYVQE